MRGVIQQLDQWGEARPWLTAIGSGLFLAALLAAITLLLDDTPNWLYVILLSLGMTLAWGLGFNRQFRRRPR
jgi:hypothetical protein